MKVVQTLSIDHSLAINVCIDSALNISTVEAASVCVRARVRERADIAGGSRKEHSISLMSPKFWLMNITPGGDCDDDELYLR